MLGKLGEFIAAVIKGLLQPLRLIKIADNLLNIVV
jgi:hypothetical protein